MNLYGWIMLTVSWATILLLLVFCFRRILKP